MFLMLTVGTTSAQDIDINIAKTINGWHMHGISRTLSASSVALPMAIPLGWGIYGSLKQDEKMLKDAIYVGTTVIEAVGLSYSIKHLTNRERPFVKYPEKVIPYGSYSDSSSFPSNHTAAAFSLATSLSITYPKWYVIVPSATWACGVGIARINQGVHYPSDVLVGASIGVGCAFANVYINKWLNKILFEK